MNMLDKIILFLSAILYHYRKELFKNNQKKITLRVYSDIDFQNDNKKLMYGEPENPPYISYIDYFHHDRN